MLGGALLADGTATGRLGSSLDLEAVVRNAPNPHYEDPIYLAIDRLPGDGAPASHPIKFGAKRRWSRRCRLRQARAPEQRRRIRLPPHEPPIEFRGIFAVALG